jgi:hypothetical protein
VDATTRRAAGATAEEEAMALDVLAVPTNEGAESSFPKKPNHRRKQTRIPPVDET